MCLLLLGGVLCAITTVNFGMSQSNLGLLAYPTFLWCGRSAGLLGFVSALPEIHAHVQAVHEHSAVRMLR